MTHKYQQEIQEFDAMSKNCPPQYAQTWTGTAYRWVFNPITAGDFLPVGIINPGRLAKEPARKKCSYFGISLHVTFDQSVDAFHFLEQSFSQIRRRLGDHVAVGTVLPAHGTCTSVDEYGHFDLHEYVGVNLQPSFKVHQKVPE